MKGVIDDVGEIVDLESKTNHKSYRKREVMLSDAKKESVIVNVWNKLLDHDFVVGEVVVFRNLKVTEYLGENSLSTTLNTSIEFLKKEESPKKRKRL